VNRRNLALLAGLILAGALAYLVRDAVSKLVLVSALYVLWAGQVVYRILPQGLWWGLFILVLAGLAWRSLARDGKQSPPSMPYHEELFDRVKSWSQWLQQRRQGDYFRWRLARNLAELSVQVLAFQERLSTEETRQRLTAGELQLPPEILNYLQAGLSAEAYRRYSGLSATLRSLPRAHPLDLDPLRVVEYLENKIAE